MMKAPQLQSFAMSKKNLNWGVPNDLADLFDAFAFCRFGGKGKWYAAIAAIAMYIEAGDLERAKYDRLALGTVIEGADNGLADRLRPKVEAMIEEMNKRPKMAAKIAKPTKYGIPAKRKSQA